MIKGDCLPSEFESQLPEHVKLDDRPLGTGQLLDCWERLSFHDQITFQKQYGDLSHLLKIRVQHACFQAMIGFWDPEYRCFTMSHMIEGKISGLVDTPWHLYLKLENFAEKHLHKVGRTTWESMFLSLNKSQSLEESILLLQILSGILWWVSMGPVDRSLLLY